MLRTSRETKKAFRASRWLLLSLLFSSRIAFAQEEESPPASFIEALIGGDVYLDVRARMETADIDRLDHSEALTFRTRLGYGTLPWHGVSLYADFENVASPISDSYFDAISRPNGKSVIADPEGTQVNQAYFNYENADLWNSSVRAGRQRLILDDSRFIGNVGWRQNEQTFDAATLRSAFGRDDMAFTYGYLWDIRRIFFDRGPAGTRDYDSDSHVLNFSYTGLPRLNVSTFIYLFDFDNSPGNSSNTYGLRLHGSTPIADQWKLAYAASYAHQTDGGNNRIDYNASYVSLDGSVGFEPAGTIGFGYELLGSDGGRARFVTPLATGHKFNGWADVFLNNGGINGLQDFYAYLAPRMPWGLKAKIVYHHFESDEGNDDLGNEIDAVISRKFLKYFEVLGKLAYYTSDGSTDPADRYRAWLQLTFHL